MAKKKIIHLIQSLDSGGCENMLLRTLPLINSFEHTIITLKKRGELAGLFEKNGISVINVNQKNLLDIVSYRRLLKTVKKIKPNLIITYLFHADILGRFCLQFTGKFKVIPFLRTTYNHPRYWQARLFEKITKNLVSHYLANSEAVKKFYVQNIGVDPKKITVIPNGIDVDYYEKIPKNPSVRKKLGIAQHNTILICVANLHVNKGHKYLLEAFESVYMTDRDKKLLLIGEGVEKSNLLKQIENYRSKRNILFLGRRDDVPKLLKNSDIFILPTFFEGMSNAIMEAMACGLPVITTDIKENRVLIKNNVSGILIPTKDSHSIELAIVLLLNDKHMADVCGNKGKKIIKKMYNTKNVSLKLSKFFETKIRYNQYS